ncbi:putative potassium transporter 8 [Camellia lanceoleosa]|uniref:Potassium transporter 8 n=1 Tax=Camellia lanceoleosa TaxID=1840588 RepID=A0ACC0IKQ4_9ERIC|nr:putative potassium transporter 8 [Camellia lanceoleosa]
MFKFLKKTRKDGWMSLGGILLCMTEDGGEERGFEEDTWAKPGLTQKALALSSNQSEPRRLHQKREVWRELNLISLNRLIEEGLPGWQPGIQERVADWDENLDKFED